MEIILFDNINQKVEKTLRFYFNLPRFAYF